MSAVERFINKGISKLAWKDTLKARKQNNIDNDDLFEEDIIDISEDESYEDMEMFLEDMKYGEYEDLTEEERELILTKEEVDAILDSEDEEEVDIEESENAPKLSSRRVKRVSTEEEYEEDEEDEEDEKEERGPLTVKDYKLIYYYRTMTLIIILLVILLICVIYMAKNDITLADLIPEKVREIQSSRIFKKLLSLLKSGN